jgi:type IV pilus assembly protein PilB
MRWTRTPAATERRRDSVAPIQGHADANGSGGDAQASVGRRLSDFIVCVECREPLEIDESSLVPYTAAPSDGRITVFAGRGCAVCSQTGLKGRVAIYEVMPVTNVIKDLIVHGARPSEICKAARDQGMRTLREAGLAKVLEGVTTLEEILRVTTE